MQTPVRGAFRDSADWKHNAFARAFPTPDTLSVRAAGVDISDSSVKWLSLKEAPTGWEINAFAQVPIESGLVEGGIVRDAERLADALKKLKEQVEDDVYVHAALPEEVAYVFSMHVSSIDDFSQVRNLIEFELEGRVPLTLDNAVFDYDIVERHSDGNAEIGVTVFPRDVVEGYEKAFHLAGLELVSLEIEARSIARAIVPRSTKGVALIADFGRARTGIAIIKSGVPIFTSTVSVGGDAMTQVIMEKMKVDEEKAEEIKNEFGIAPGKDQKVSEAVSGTAGALADEITRHYQYWDAKRDEHGERSTPVRQVLLCGGSSNLKGLPEYIAGRVHDRTQRANVWVNVCDFDTYIPPITKNHSLGYATAIGLALRSV